MRTRWELTLRGRMLATLASLALCGAWITGDVHASLAAALLIAPILIDRLWKGRGLPPLELALAERRTQVGGPFLESVHLRNTGRRRAVHDLHVVEPRIGTRMGGGCVDALEPGAGAVLRLPARCLRRGVWTERRFLCETGYPLGMLRLRAEIACEARLVSEPARITLPAHVLRAADDSAAEPSSRQQRGSEEFYAMREYRWGGDARQVHALRSASAGALMCRVTRGQQARQPCMVLDLRRPPGHGTRRTGPRFEWSLSAAATLVDELVRTGAELTCFVLGRRPRRLAVATLADAEDLLALFAKARPGRHATLDEDWLRQIEEFQSCFWIPAGGFAARVERAALQRVVLVSRDEEDG